MVRPIHHLRYLSLPVKLLILIKLWIVANRLILWRRQWSHRSSFDFVLVFVFTILNGTAKLTTEWKMTFEYVVVVGSPLMVDAKTASLFAFARFGVSPDTMLVI